MRDAAFPSLAIGFFDGVHLGHRAILRGRSAALTFVNHPLTLIDPKRAPALIMTSEERLAAIKAEGVSQVKMIEFTPALMRMGAAEFAERYLKGMAVFCGEDWRFGFGGAGTGETLRAAGFAVTTCASVDYQGRPISSSRIRLALAAGDVAAAAAMLGRPFALTGRRFAGKGLGRGIGFPTVNLEIDRDTPSPLRTGVYEVHAAGMQALANYGYAPTMKERAWAKPTLELHFLKSAFDEGRLPAWPLRVNFVRFLREERSFSSLDELKLQLAADLKDLAVVV